MTPGQSAAPSQASWSWQRAAGAAAKDLIPAMIALAPLAIVVGVTVQRTARGTLLGVASAPAIFAGTAQLSLLAMLQSGAGVVAVVGSVAVINARLLLYAAALEPRFRDQSGWFRWLAPHFVVDPTFALVTARHDLDNAGTFRRYWLAMGGGMAVVWTGLVGLGVVLGPALGRGGGVLAFAPVAVFLAMVAPRLTDRPSVAAAGVGGMITGALAYGDFLPAGAPVLVGAAVGVVAGTLTGRSRR